MDARPFDSPWHTFRRMADYRGRSTRSELLYFGLLAVLAGYGVSFLASGTRFAGDETLRTLFLLFFLAPSAPLLVRRLHDSGRDGTWAAAGLPALVTIVFQRWQRHSGHPEFLFDGRWTPLELAGALSVLALLALALAPPVEGSNRHGPDPRASRAGEAG